MFPEDFIDRIKQQSYLDVPALLSALGKPGKASVRLNPGKWNYVPVSSTPVQWCENGYYLESRPIYTLDPLFHSGCYYPQEASSMFLGQVFRQVVCSENDLRVLDLCAAPGGKSTHLSSLVSKNGVLIANEVIRPRASVLAENVTKWGTGNIIVTNNDPSSFAGLGQYFDLIVVDAPCSGEGMFRDEVARKEWSVANTILCAERQRRILQDVWPALKLGGKLIYSTCTFNPAENEENVYWLAKKYNAESIPLKISDYTGITEIAYKGINGYGFHPGKTEGEGFFISVLKKSGSATGSKPVMPGKNSNQISKAELKIADKLTSGLPDRIYINNDIIWSLAVSVDEFSYLKKHLKIIKAGTQLFRMRGSDFTPVHDLSLSLLLKNDAFPVYETDYFQAISFLKKENITLPLMQTGWTILSYRNINLGFVKNIGTRLNNYFPIEWRIRMTVKKESGKDLIKWHGN